MPEQQDWKIRLIRTAAWWGCLLLFVNFVAVSISAAGTLGGFLEALIFLGLGVAALIGVYRKWRWTRKCHMLFACFCIYKLARYTIVLYWLPYVTRWALLPGPVLISLYSALLYALVKSRDYFEQTPQATTVEASTARYTLRIALPFMMFISSCGSLAHAQDVVVSPRVVQLGDTFRSGSVSGKVAMTNHTSDSVNIEVEESCGCTITSAPSSLAAGTKGFATFHIYTFDDNPGKQTKLIYVKWTSGRRSVTVPVNIEYSLREEFLVHKSQREIVPSDANPNADAQNIFLWSWMEPERAPQILTKIEAEKLGKHILVANEFLDFRYSLLRGTSRMFMQIIARPKKAAQGHAGQVVYAQLRTRSGQLIEIPFRLSNEFGEDRTAMKAENGFHEGAYE